MINKFYQNEKIKYIKSIYGNCYKYFRSKSNVVGVGIGYKTTRGFNTFDLCIKILVNKKLHVSELNTTDIIPKYYKGIKTDVVGNGEITSSGFTDKIRPSIGGYSISPASINSRGTLGCLVTDGKNIYILGSNHILADENTLSIGERIIQPGVLDGGNLITDVICKLSRYIELKYMRGGYEPENYCDCAVAKVTSKSQVSSKIALIGNLKGVKDPVLERKVEKAGSSSGLTLGFITLINSSIELNLREGICIFEDVIGTTKMSEKGDSGSILVDEHNYAIGMLIGSNETTSFYTPIKNVLKSLNVALVK